MGRLAVRDSALLLDRTSGAIKERRCVKFPGDNL